MSRKRRSGGGTSVAEPARSKRVPHPSAARKKIPAVLPSQPTSWPPRSEKEIWGLALLVVAVVFSVVYAAPELRIGRVPLNDVVFHLAASERMETSFARGEPFLDPWVSEWALGYPVWRSYQPVGHIVAAAAIHIFRPLADPASTFAVVFYLLIVTLPVSVYVGARLFGLSPPASGLAALLVWAASADGDPGRYGISYGSVLWRGSGLYTQLFALHLLAISFGLVARALDAGGRARRAGAGLVLALTSLSHIIFGYAAFVSAALLAVVGPRGERSRRLVRLVSLALLGLLLMAWFLIPLVLAKGSVGHNRWEAAQKWDSYGAPYILRELLWGRLLDYGRLPLLTGLLAAGVVGAVLSWREPVARRLLGLCGLWLILFFGRETWGHLMLFAGVPADLHLHRLEAVFELSAVLLAAYGTTRLIASVARRTFGAAIVCALVVAAAVVSMGRERSSYLEQNQTWGEQNLTAYSQEQGDLKAALNDVHAILAVRPGRVSAGLAAGWGRDFKLGSVPVYAFLSQDHLDQASFLYHSMSKPSEVMVLREDSLAHDTAFGIRAVVAPSDRAMPSYLQLRSKHGRFAVYESSPEGYFGVVDVSGHYSGPASTTYEPSSAWLKSPLLSWGVVVSLDPRAPIGPAIPRWEPLPQPTATEMQPRGWVVSETKTGETYHAQLALERPAYALVKISWHPDLVATVDGRRAALLEVTPGFGAVPVPAGQHEVEVSFRPGPLKPLLLFIGMGLFAAGCIVVGRGWFARFEAAFAARVATLGERLATPRFATATVLTLAAIVALHPLVRGKLISGHDATEYPPRVVEFAKVVRDGQIPPVWAPDLAAGHGQPLFEFAPPLVYLGALPFRALGLGLADSLQFGLAVLHLLGAIAFYRIGRMFTTSRSAALAGSIAWLFAPYLALDLYVRAAFAEASAVAVLPIAVLGLIKSMERPTPAHVSLGAIGVALIMLGHNAVALLVVPALALTVVLRASANWRAVPRLPLRPRIAPLVSGLFTIAAGLGLSAYFWLPAIAEKGFTHTERLREGVLHWQDHFVWPRQLLWSGWGYGLSGPGPNNSMSFALGPLHLLLAITGCVLAWRLLNQRLKNYVIAFAVAALAGAWLSTFWASTIWDHVQLLQFMVYPWRSLVLPGLLLSLLALFAFERMGPKWRVAAVLAVVLFNLPHTEPQGYLTFDDEYYAPQSIATKGINTTTREEYEPRDVQRRPPYDPRGLFGVDSAVNVEEISRSSSRQEFLVRADLPTTVEASTLMYPGWSVMVDGSPVAVSTTPVRGTIRFHVSGGQHRVLLRFGRTALRSMALSLTAASFVLMAVAFALDRRIKVLFCSPRFNFRSAAGPVVPT